MIPSALSGTVLIFPVPPCRKYPKGKEQFEEMGWCPPPRFCYDQMEPIRQVTEADDSEQGA